MSFIIEYRPFINVTVEEEGTGASLDAFRFTPTAACRRTMADLHLVFRPRDAGFQIFYQQNPMATDPLLGVISSRIRLSFAATSLRSDLFETYEPDFTAETGSQLYLDNLTPSGNIQVKNTLTVSTVVQVEDASRMLPPVFEATADTSVAPPPTQWHLRDPFDGSDAILPKPIAATAPGLTRTKLDASAVPTGPYTLETDEASPPAQTVYVDEELAFRSVQGVVDLYWEARQDTVPVTGLDYFIRFRRR